MKFTNFSFANLFRKNDNYRGILPQGDGQTLTISGQTNGRYYQSYSVSFFDPWFGGKRPNSFSVSAFYSIQTDVSSQYYNSAYMNNYYNMLSGYGYYGGYGNYYDNYESYYDPDKSIKMFGVSVGWGKRLRWPDDYFTLSAELSYQRFMLKDWSYLYIKLNNGQYMNTGNCNNLSLNLTLSRNSTDNPIFPRYGSEFSASLQITPPYSLFSKKDYSTYGKDNYHDAASMYKWIEYHKWKFKAKTYTALMDIQKCPVIMTRAEFGLLGHYNKYKKSPFETFYMGGDGMSGYSSTYAQETIGLRGYENGSIAGNGGYNSYGYAYSRLAMELRYPFLLEPSSTIYGLVFVEAGNAWTDLKNFNPFNLKRSAGVGVRIFLPMIGLMGLDWAYGFDEPNYGSNGKRSGSNLHFIIGQEF